MDDLNDSLSVALAKAVCETAGKNSIGESFVKDFLASLAANGYAIVPVEATATHKKRGTTYDVISDLALLQTDVPLTDMAEVVIYRCRDTGYYWVRRHAEFHDGRFMLAAAPKE